MAAYLIFVRNKLKDADAMATYGPLARASMEGHAMERLVAYGDLEVLEGNPAEGVVILKFEDMAAARAWFFSPEYQKAAEHRQLGSDYQVLLANGV
jgi:uncharacterized protein (DUF1330 family)